MQAKTPNFDRRITLQEPGTVTNDYNEKSTVWETVYEFVPAYRNDNPTAEREGTTGAVLRAQGEVEWQTRYLGSTRPRANWRIIDQYGDKYDIIAPPVEIGRRQGWKYLTRYVQ